MQIFHNIEESIHYSINLLKTYGQVVSTEKWQGIENPNPMFEILNLNFLALMPNTQQSLAIQTDATLPWAEDHFQERIHGIPHNPGNQYKNWPFYKNVAFNDSNFRKDEKFTHTYMERYWPKFANDKRGNYIQDNPNQGIRYEYGDLNDVIGLLEKEPMTRQAYMPVWFPEDTGVLHGGRVPCSIGYHFMLRNNMLHINYLLRSCDALRHFRNDIYMTVRLGHHILQKLKERDGKWEGVTMGVLNMSAVSFHVFNKEKNLI